MSVSVGCSHFTLAKPVAAFLLSLFAFSAYGFSEPLQSLDINLLNGVVVAVGVLVFVLAVSLLVLKKIIKNKDGLLVQSHQQQQLIQEQIDRSISGMVQVDKAGKVLYTNRRACAFLGQKLEQMLGKEFVDLCPDEISEQIHDALKHDEEQQFQCQMGHFLRHVRLRVSPQKNPIGDIAVLIAIDDVDRLQKRIETQQAANIHLQRSIEYAEISSASLCFAQQALTLNTPLQKMLGPSTDADFSLDAFNQFIATQNRAEWKFFVSQLGEGKAHSLNIHLLVNEKLVPVKVSGEPKVNDDQKSASSASLFFESQVEVERLKLQAALFQTQLNTVMNASPLPIYRLNGKKQIVECNRPFCALFQTELSRLRNKRVDEVEVFDEIFKEMHQGIEGVGKRQKSACISLKDERQIELNLHFLAYKLGNEHEGTIAIIEDLSPINQLQRELEACETTLSNLIEQSPMGIAVFNDEDQIVQVNTSLTDMLGNPAEKLAQQTFYQLFQNPEESGTAARLLHQTGQLKNFNAALFCANGQSFSTRLDVGQLPGETSKYVAWVQDARDLEYLSHQFDQLFTASNMAVAILGTDGFTKLNPAACDFFSVKSQDDLLGLSPASNSLNTSDDNAEKMQGYLERVKQGERISEIPWEHQHNGTTLPCEVSFVPLLEQSVHAATLCVWADLRALKQADAARLEAVNMRQVAEREIAEKKQLLQNSQDLLASRARSLQDTQEKLLAAENDLAQKVDTIQGLRQAHEDISDNLQSLQSDYERNRALLIQSQQANVELEGQLEESSDKVNQLQKQRNQIADALQNSERSYKKAQQELAESEQTTQRLKQEQESQQQSLQAAKAQIDTLKGSIEVKDREISDVSVKINSLQSQLHSSGQASEKLREQLVNQRKASEIAERKRRELELNCQAAQAELNNKSGYVEHLQHEMKMLELMSQQQKGDMEKQTRQLAEELKDKQQLLDDAEQQLLQAKQQAEQDKQHSAQREHLLQQLQNELEEVERRSAEQHQKIAESDAAWKEQQAMLQQELREKQRALQETTERLDNTKQQTEEEKSQQTALLETLRAELREVEQRAIEQDQKIAQSDKVWQQKQQALAEELNAKKAQLDETQQQLNEHQQQVETEKLERKVQQDKLNQLKQEMANVASRASKQRELMQGNDEQWRQHHAEIEEQKQQLQKALEEAQAQNRQMKSTLDEKLESLKHAETTVSKTHSDEQKLQRELATAKEQADELKTRLARQENQEHQLKKQVAKQQSSLQQRENSILALQEEQKRLTEALDSVKHEYAQSKASVKDQNSSQQQLTEQLKALESELKTSKQQLNDKELALEDAQKQIANSADKLAAHEKALIEAQKDELKQAKQLDPQESSRPLPEFAKHTMPGDPNVWFELLPYLQQQEGVTSLASSLQSLMDSVYECVESMDKAVADYNEGQIHLTTVKLIKVLETIHSSPVRDIARRLQQSSEDRLIDNIAISWPPTRNSLMTTLRVIYSHLQAQ